MEGLFAALVCITMLVAPPALIFALHYRWQRPHSRKMTRLRIAVYSILLYLFIGAFVTMGFTLGEVEYIDRSCREPYDCHNIIAIAHAELWMRTALYPISQDICFTGNEYACEYIDREVKGLWSPQGAFEEDKGIALFGYYIGAVIFAVPSLILFFVLRRVYLVPRKQKRKNDELAKSKLRPDSESS